MIFTIYSLPQLFILWCQRPCGICLFMQNYIHPWITGSITAGEYGNIAKAALRDSFPKQEMQSEYMHRVTTYLVWKETCLVVYTISDTDLFSLESLHDPEYSVSSVIIYSFWCNILFIQCIESLHIWCEKRFVKLWLRFVTLIYFLWNHCTTQNLVLRVLFFNSF